MQLFQPASGLGQTFSMGYGTNPNYCFSVISFIGFKLRKFIITWVFGGKGFEKFTFDFVLMERTESDVIYQAI